MFTATVFRRTEDEKTVYIWAGAELASIRPGPFKPSPIHCQWEVRWDVAFGSSTSYFHRLTEAAIFIETILAEWLKRGLPNIAVEFTDRAYGEPNHKFLDWV